MSKPQKKVKPKKQPPKPQPQAKATFGDVVKRELKYIANGQKRLTADFLGSITVILVTVLIIVSLAIMSGIQEFDKELTEKTNALRDANSSNVFHIIETSASINEFQLIDTLSSMQKSNIIAYAVLTNPQTNEILFTTLQSTKLDGDEISKSTLAANNMKNTVCITKKTPDIKLYIGFYEEDSFIENVSKLAQNYLFILGLCLLLGLWLALGLCRRVLKPVSELVKVTGAFSKGDLSERLEQTKYVEFNELVDAYNIMADSMQRLYSSLEHKVNERTRQLNEAIKELQDTQAMMVHSEKMKSLGELVAGIMHEINNPINFIYGNMSHLKNYSADLISLIDSFEEYKNDLSEEHKKAYEQMLKDIDYEFLKEDLPDLIKSCHEGTERTKNIILNLKDFSRMEESAITNVELPKEIDSTLNILHNKFKNKITVHKDYHEDVPKIEAYGGQLNQVFMNILDNAAFAVSEMEHGDVWITIRKDDKFAYIEIQDNGKGMTEETKNKIFNPFFTTKPVGQGTGLGLSISYKVIKNHNGVIDVVSEVGKGTKFTIKLPLVFEHKEQQAEKKNENEIEVI